MSIVQKIQFFFTTLQCALRTFVQWKKSVATELVVRKFEKFLDMITFFVPFMTVRLKGGGLFG